MPKTYGSYKTATKRKNMYSKKYGGKFIVKKLFGRYVVKRPRYGRGW